MLSERTGTEDATSQESDVVHQDQDDLGALLTGQFPTIEDGRDLEHQSHR